MRDGPGVADWEGGKGCQLHFAYGEPEVVYRQPNVHRPPTSPVSSATSRLSRHILPHTSELHTPKAHTPFPPKTSPCRHLSFPHGLHSFHLVAPPHIPMTPPHFLDPHPAPTRPSLPPLLRLPPRWPAASPNDSHPAEARPGRRQARGHTHGTPFAPRAPTAGCRSHINLDHQFLPLAPPTGTYHP